MCCLFLLRLHFIYRMSTGSIQGVISQLHILILFSCVGPTELDSCNRFWDVNIHHWRFRYRLTVSSDMVELFLFGEQCSKCQHLNLFLFVEVKGKPYLSNLS